MTVGLNSRPIEWSRLPEPHPPDAGCWCSRNKRRPYVSLIWCEHAIGSWKRAQTLDPKQRPENCYEPLNLTLDCLHAHVSGHLLLEAATPAAALPLVGRPPAG
jgi:hypothetical protein